MIDVATAVVLGRHSDFFSAPHVVYLVSGRTKSQSGERHELAVFKGLYKSANTNPQTHGQYFFSAGRYI